MTNTATSLPLNGALRLADWGVIRARGADARTFLQGQLTNDVNAVKPGIGQLNGYCSPKGRLLASFVMLQPADDEFVLACSADLLPPTLKRLSMFVMRAQCKLTDATAELTLWGVAGSAVGDLGVAEAAPYASAALEDGHVVELPAVDGVRRVLAFAPAEGALATRLAAVAPLSADAWADLEVRSGVVRVVAATSEQFVPQMVNLELVGGVSFKKGCYPGQEVVARSQYRGTLKRRTYLASVAGTAQPGQEIYVDGDGSQPAGMVALAATGHEATAALIEIKRDLAGAALRIGDAAGPALTIGHLPYEIPVDEH